MCDLFNDCEAFVPEVKEAFFIGSEKVLIWWLEMNVGE
jgi:hypothetical protein